MTFLSEASKLLTNKYFLYFIVFLSATNVLGYLVTNKLNAVAFFTLTGFLTYQFSKNMAVILLISIIATNFMMSNKMLREGMDNTTTITPNSDAIASALENVDAKDAEIADNLPVVQNSSSVDAINTKKQAQNIKTEQPIKTALSDNTNVDINNPELNNTSTEPAPEGFGEKMSNNKKGKQEEHFGPRLDYAATIEQSYQNLDSLLGSDSIKQLTGDTQKLMQQQQNLFNTMNQMVPVLEGAQNMLKGFDMSSLTKSLGDMGALASAPTAINKKNKI